MTAADTPIDPRVHVDHVELRVQDVERSIAFYRDVLGLELAEAPGHGRAASLRAAGGGPVLVRLRVSDAPGPAPDHATGLFHTALRWPTRAGLGGALLRLAHAGYPLTGASDHGVSEALYLDDPDRNGVELYWDRPRDVWPQPGPGERVGMFTRPLDLRALVDVAETADAGVDVGHVHLKVADLAATVDFWHGVLGLGLQQRFGSEAAFLAAGDYHHHLGVNTWLSRGAAPGPPDRPGLDRFALAYPDEASLADARERLAGAGVAVEGDRFEAPGGIGAALALAA